MLYKCKTTINIDGIYIISLAKYIKSKCSLIIIQNNKTQLSHNAILTHCFWEFLDDWDIAKKEIIRNTTSINCHHIGVSEQQLTEQDFIIKINGVAKQCIKHKTPATAPT